MKLGLKSERAADLYGRITRLPKYMEHPGHGRLERKVRRGSIVLGIKVHIEYKDGTVVDKVI